MISPAMTNRVPIATQWRQVAHHHPDAEVGRAPDEVDGAERQPDHARPALAGPAHVPSAAGRGALRGLLRRARTDPSDHAVRPGSRVPDLPAGAPGGSGDDGAVKPLDPRLLALRAGDPGVPGARGRRRGRDGAAGVVAQAALVADAGRRWLPARPRAWPTCADRCSRWPRWWSARAVLAWVGELAAHRSAADASSPSCARRCSSAWSGSRPGGRVADRRDRDAGHPRGRRAGRLLRPLPAPAGARGGRAAVACWSSLLGPGPGRGADRRGDAAADPAVDGRGRARPPAASTDAQLRTLQRLAGHFLDVVAGLPTLKVFGRAKAQARAIRQVTDDYRRTTMGTLRLAFVSSLVLELVATLSVALVAVSVGLRLLDCAADLPDRAVRAGARPRGVPAAAPGRRELPRERRGHGCGGPGVRGAGRSTDGPHGPRTDVPDPSEHAIEVSRADGRRTRAGASRRSAGVSLPGRAGRAWRWPGRAGAASPRCSRCCWASCARRPDRCASAASTSPSSTRTPGGRRSPGCRSARTCSPARSRTNVRLGRPDAGRRPTSMRRRGGRARRRWWRGCRTGCRRRLGERGAGLSAGERQRVALARAFLRDAPLLLLDEPTAGLDGATEAQVLAAVRRLAAGRTVVLVAHRPGLLALADQVVASRAPRSVLAIERGPDLSRPYAPSRAGQRAGTWRAGRLGAARCRCGACRPSG